MPDIPEPFSDAEMLKMAKEMMVRKVKRAESTEHSPDLKPSASAGLMDWLLNQRLDNLGKVSDYCIRIQSDPVAQLELLRFDPNDRRALAKVISMIDPVAGRPMMLFLLNPPGQNPDAPLT